MQHRTDIYVSFCISSSARINGDHARKAQVIMSLYDEAQTIRSILYIYIID